MIDLATEEDIAKPKWPNRTKKYSKNQLIEILQQWANKNGRIPTEKDFYKNLDLPNFKTYRREFGTWNNALIVAGIGIRQREREKKYSRDQLIEILQQWEKDNNKIPKEKDFTNNPNFPYYTTYINEFGTWNNALINAGIGIRQKEKKYSRDQLIEILQQ